MLSFIDKANLRFANKFDYSKFEYVNAKTRGVIICPTHGEFTQTPDKHLNSTHACPICHRLYKKKTSIAGRLYPRKTFQAYYDKYLSNVQGVRFDLVGEWKGCCHSEILMTCDIHGPKVLPSSNLRRSRFKCSRCSIDIAASSRTNSKEATLIGFKEVHGEKYSYCFDNFTNTRSKIAISCPEHGIFHKTVMKHLTGQGCPKCKLSEGKKAGKYPGGYNHVYF